MSTGSGVTGEVWGTCDILPATPSVAGFLPAMLRPTSCRKLPAVGLRVRPYIPVSFVSGQEQTRLCRKSLIVIPSIVIPSIVIPIAGKDRFGPHGLLESGLLKKCLLTHFPYCTKITSTVSEVPVEFFIDPNSRSPICRQLTRQIREAVARGNSSPRSGSPRSASFRGPWSSIRTPSPGYTPSWNGRGF